MNIKNLLSKLEFTDDIKYNKTFSIVTYTVLCLVASFMTLLNIVTDKGFLTACTAIFAFLCIVNIMLALSGEVLLRISKLLFSIEVMLMFTFFLVSGNPEGFSAIWICMLPSLGMFFFDRTRGSIICAGMFIIMVFFLWTDLGNSFLIYQYTDSFKMRFPVLFIAFHALAFLLETLRSNAYSSMKKMWEYYQDLSVRDQLTGMFNRQGMYSELEKREEYSRGAKIGIAMFDIDFFKSVNDNYGHNVGDITVNLCICTQELINKEASRNRLKENLSRAIDREEFDLFLQFIHDTKKEKFTGAEVLSRWNNPEEGFLTPAHYIKDMRTTGVIVKFDYYIIDKTCKLLDTWKKTGFGELDLSCNLTRITISDDNFLKELQNIVNKYDFDHNHLILEITEDAFTDNQAVAYKNIAECKNEGFQIAIDDFGVGHSSFSDLCDYPVDIIKVDRSLIVKSSTKRGNSLLEGLVKLSHDLNIEVVCEGVETEEQKNTITNNGCDYIQGYYYSYVYPIDEGIEYFEQSLKKNDK